MPTRRCCWIATWRSWPHLPAQFEAYDQAIAEEYRDRVPGFLYRINRRRFLRAVLAMPRIFLSDWFHERCDAQARINLQRAIG